MTGEPTRPLDDRILDVNLAVLGDDEGGEPQIGQVAGGDESGPVSKTVDAREAPPVDGDRGVPGRK